MKTVYVSLSGTNLSSGFIPKEMSLYFPDDQSWRHYFFNTPPGRQLTENDIHTDWYTRRVLGGIGLHDALPGSLHYNQHRDLLRMLGMEYQIICSGRVTYDHIVKLLPYADVINSPLVYPKELPPASCGIKHRARFCSLAKLWHLVEHS